MNKISKNKTVKWIIAALIIITVAAVVLYLLKRFRSSDYIEKIINIGGKGNVEILNELNKNWKLPEDYSLEVKKTGKITMEWVQKKGSIPEKAILQLHGGAYTRSLKDNGTTYQRSALQYARISGAGVLTVDYRVAPEHPYPAALEDALAAYQWLLEQGFLPENIIIAGDSAGGGLALATVMYIRDNNMPKPAAVITMSAWTNLNYRRRTPAYAGNNKADNPYISPFYGEYDSFPPMLMQVGGDEFLLNDTVKVAEKAENAGVSVRQTTYPGMFHDFQMLFPRLDEANKAWVEVEEFINEIYKGR